MENLVRVGLETSLTSCPLLSLGSSIWRNVCDDASVSEKVRATLHFCTFCFHLNLAKIMVLIIAIEVHVALATVR